MNILLTDLSDTRILLIITEPQPSPGFNRKIEVFSESWEAGAGAGKNITSLFKYLYYAQLLRLSGDTIFWKKVLSYQS